jgi:hypothetical protein
MAKGDARKQLIGYIPAGQRKDNAMNGRSTWYERFNGREEEPVDEEELKN